VGVSPVPADLLSAGENELLAYREYCIRNRETAGVGGHVEAPPGGDQQLLRLGGSYKEAVGLAVLPA
jgi:hypothetical protein